MACQIDCHFSIITDPLFRFLGPVRQPQRSISRNPLEGIDPDDLLEMFNKMKGAGAGNVDAKGPIDEPDEDFEDDDGARDFCYVDD